MSEESIYKIRASRVNSISAEQYDGYEGLIWYDTFTGELRIWDNNVPGGRLIYDNIGTGNSIASGTTNVSIPVLNGNVAVTVGGVANTVVFGTGNTVFAGNLLPTANNTYTLGTADLQWKSLHVGGNTIYIDNNALSATGPNLYWNGDQVIAANANGIINAGSISVSGNITGGNLTINGTIAGSFIPATSNTYSLGNSTNRWANLWLTGTTIYLGNSIIDSAPDGSTVNILTANALPANVVAGNVNTAGLISATGNITGNYILGNGSQLTGISVSSNKIFNGNSYANIAAPNGNVEINANGRSWTFGTNGNLTLPGNSVSINYANGTPYGTGSGSSLPPQTGNVGKILSTDGTNPLWATMPGVFGLVIDGGDAAYSSSDFIIDGGAA